MDLHYPRHFFMYDKYFFLVTRGLAYEMFLGADLRAEHFRGSLCVVAGLLDIRRATRRSVVAVSDRGSESQTVYIAMSIRNS